MKLKIILGLVLFGSLAYAAVGDQYLKGTLTAEQLTSTDDADIVDNLTCGDMVIDETDGVLNFSGGTSATISTGTADLTLAPATGITNLGTGDLAFTPASGAQCIFDEQGGTCGTRTDDANANNRTINSSDVWSFAATAKTPGNLVLRGGLDSKTFNVLDGLAGCTAADTAVVTRTINGTVTGPTTLTYGTDWGTGGGLTATIAATQLAAAIEALSGVGATASGATCPGGAANARCVGVTADRLTSNVTISNNDDSCTVDSSGTDGSIVTTGSGKIDFGSQRINGSYTGGGVFFSNQSDTVATVWASNVNIGSLGARTGSFGANTYLASGNTINWYSAATIETGGVDLNLTRGAAGKILVSGSNTTTNAMAYSYPKTITTADSGADANPGATTINPADANTIILVCNDDDGCTGTITETAAAAGMRVTLLALGGYTTTIADSAGVIEASGGVSIGLTALDTVELIYDGAQWLQAGPVTVN